MNLEHVAECPACGGRDRTPEVKVRAQMMPRDAPEEGFTFVRCSRCGLVFLDPRIPAERLPDYYTPAYLPYRGPGAWGGMAPLVALGLRGTDGARVELVRERAAPGPGTRVLDVGCGRPTFLEALVRATGCRGMGTDFSANGWTGDGERWAGLELRVGELGELDFDAPVDVATMWHYLEHDYHPRATLTRVRELMRGSTHPAGPLLVVEVPDHDSWTRRRHGAWWAGYHAPRHTALYDPRSMRALLERSGWEVVDILRTGTLDPYLLHWMSRMEAAGVDWEGGMGGRFPGFLLGRILWGLRFGRRREGLGFLTAVARPRE